MNDNIETSKVRGSPWANVWAPEFCLACHEQLFTCECIDVDFMNFQHGRETAQDERATQQQEDETMTRQKEESTQDEMTTQRQDVTEIEAVDHEHEKGGDKVIHVKHQGKLQSMPKRDFGI